MRLWIEISVDIYVGSCTSEEQDEFFRMLRKIRSEPIGNSEAISDPRLSRYMLRFFRFGNNIAIFQYRPAEDLIKVLECRKLPLKELDENQKEDTERDL
jgi:hypothetical protein